MGKFKRYDGYVGCIPQKFIDSHLPVCPFCGSNNPHWLLDSRLEMTLAGSRTYYQCECCHGIMSSTAADAGAENGKNFMINPAMAAMNAAHKGTKHQEVGVAYMRVDDLGTVCTHQEWLGQEFSITYFQDVANGLAAASAAQPAAPQYAQPAAPQYAQPQYAQPTAPQYAQPQYAQPAAPQYAQPQYAQPAAPQYAQPQYAQPAAPQYAQPQYAQPAAPQYAQPQYAQPAAPQYAQPQYAQPAAPQYAQPAAPAPVQQGNKFPLVPTILVGTAAFIKLFSVFNTGPIMYLLLNLLSYTPYILSVLGITLMGKKEKNVLLGIAFFSWTFSGLVWQLFYTIQYGGRPSAMAIIFSILGWGCMVVIGISYLKGRSGKLMNLIGIGSLVTLDLMTRLDSPLSGKSIFYFLFVTVSMFLGLFLHTMTKFKEE